MRGRTWLAAVLLLVTSPGLSACFGDDAEPGPSPTPAAEQLTVRTRVTRVAGRLGREERRRLEARAGELVEEYVAAAFLGRGRDPFPGFTAGARRRAEQDRRVLTIDGDSGDGTSVQRASAYLAVLAHRRRAAGATARLQLDLAVPSGAGTDTVRVSGRLLLTPTRDGWRIFGYHLTRGASR